MRRALERHQCSHGMKNKRIYVVQAYHGLHCVKFIYDFVKAVRDNSTETPSVDHVLHCLDSLHKDITCYADDELRPRLYQADFHSVKTVGEPRRCRDWSAMDRWVRERHACYRYHVDLDPGDVLRSQMKFCPDNSPYLPAVRDYFGKGDDWFPLDMGK